MPKNNNKNNKQQSKVVQGPTALNRIIKSAKDQVRDATIHRYAKRGGLAQVAADVKELRKLLNTEEKHIDTQTGSTAVAVGTSQVLAVGTVAEGSDNNQRTGRSIKIVRTDINIYFAFATGTPATTAYQTQIFNWYYIKYLKTPSASGAVPFSIGEFLNADSGANYSPLSLPNTDTSQNFAILAAGSLTMEINDTTTASSTLSRVLSIQVDRSFHQTYDGTTAGTISDNMCFLVFTAINPINTGGSSTINAAVRQWYVDN